MQARITEEQIRDLVFAFYAKVQADPLLGSVFESRLAGRWDAHLDKMCDFWSGILLATGRFRGDPVRVHAQIAEITPGHFDRWLELFDETAHEVLPTPIAVDIVTRSQRMRLVLERAAASQAHTP